MADPAACRDVVKSIARCMRDSACIKEGNTVAQCFNGNDVPECDKYRKAYFECRRGQLDMRTRIRGPKYIETAAKDRS